MTITTISLRQMNSVEGDVGNVSQHLHSSTNGFIGAVALCQLPSEREGPTVREITRGTQVKILSLQLESEKIRLLSYTPNGLEYKDFTLNHEVKGLQP